MFWFVVTSCVLYQCNVLVSLFCSFGVGDAKVNVYSAG